MRNSLGHANGKCRCTPDQVARYRGKISGPLLDRIDLQIEVPALPEADLTRQAGGEASAAIQVRVEAAYRRQLVRQGKPNAQLGTKEIEGYCQPDAAGEDLLKQAINRLNLSARGYHRVLKVGDIPARQLRMVQVWIDLHRDELLADWELASAGEEPFRIDPLK